jgi:hypothetical protein
MAAIIQFIHPGPEHGPDGNYQSIKSWNDDKHQRKFLLSSGDYVENDTIKKGELVFWGEWEPPSIVKPLPPPANRYPHWLHLPYLPPNYMELVNEQFLNGSVAGCCSTGCAGGNLQNTDPFVFGDHFLYGICQQNSRPFMAHLPAGSLILFGTRYGDTYGKLFHLDTVFVVKGYIDYDVDNVDTIATSKIPANNGELYKNISLKLACPCKKSPHVRQRLYWGVSWNEKDKFDGMYSFSPAKLYNNADPEKYMFSPVIIRDKNFITDDLTQGINSHEKNTGFAIETVKKLWESIRDQCRNAGCVEAVRFEIPKVKEE